MIHRFTSERRIPEGAVPVTVKGAEAVAYLYTSPWTQALCAIGYQGKAKKPAFDYAFPTADARTKYVSTWVQNVLAAEATKQQEREEKRAWEHGLTVGTILYGSWGYEQTQCEFYEVVEVRGKSVFIRELCAEVVRANSSMSDFRKPRPGCYFSETVLRRIPQRGYKGEPSVKLNDFCHLSPWDGREAYCSWYA